MLKELRKMKGEPVVVNFEDKESMGGGIDSGEPKLVLLFLGADRSWFSFKWEWSGQIVVVPASDIVCIASDT